jgi:hypothetical protein
LRRGAISGSAARVAKSGISECDGFSIGELEAQEIQIGKFRSVPVRGTGMTETSNAVTK